jgi:hypothetical protein
VRAKRLYAAVGLVAAVVYVGALWNHFALDDDTIIVFNPLVHALSGVWRAFAHPYWPVGAGGYLYRPLPIATYAFDGAIGGAWWFHLVNLVWHAGACIAVAALARRWRGDAAGLIAGLLFAVHPVHVEAVANVIGRAELMATVFSLLAVYAALVTRSVWWSTAALALAILSKENAVVVPALVAWAWILGIDRPPRARMVVMFSAWALAAIAWLAARRLVIHGDPEFPVLADVFVGASPSAIRLTAVAALADVTRLLVFPLHLRVDYSPAERTLVTSPLDLRFVAGLVCATALAWLVVLAWRRGRRLEAFGLGWIAIAYLPVANLVLPIGVLVAERTLYLPSAGLALAAGAWLSGLTPRRRAVVVAALVLAGAARTALRVPTWRNDTTMTLSILDDSPRSFRGPLFTASLLQANGSPKRALEYYRRAFAIYDRDARSLFGAADAAFTVGEPALADSLLAETRSLCGACREHLLSQAAVALARGDSAVAESLLVRQAAQAPRTAPPAGLPAPAGTRP